MRREAAIRIDLQRGKRQDDAFHFRIGQPFERLQEEPRVVDGIVEILVGGQHEQHRRALLTMGGRRGGKRTGAPARPVIRETGRERPVWVDAFSSRDCNAREVVVGISVHTRIPALDGCEPGVASTVPHCPMPGRGLARVAAGPATAERIG